jgi:hypothetical protein
VLKISSIGIVSARIEIKVGVAEGKVGVAAASGVNVGVTDASSGGEDVGVDKTSTEKVQASSKSAASTKQITNKKYFDRFIAFSLSAMVGSQDGRLLSLAANDHKTFILIRLFHCRATDRGSEKLELFMLHT